MPTFYTTPEDSLRIPTKKAMRAMDTKGFILQSSYRLRRHLLAEWPLSRWIGLLLLAAATGSLFISWLHPWAAVLIGLLYLAFVLVMAWASRREYVHYESRCLDPSLDLEPPGEPPLRPEELVPVRASGWFSVEGQDKYYVDLEADFETVATREHILLGRVYPSRYLGVGNWPVEDLGWWYIFFQPDMICELDLGLLHFGPEARRVLRLVYRQDPRLTQTIYLAFGSKVALRRVWADLLLDAPPDVALPDWLQASATGNDAGPAAGASEAASAGQDG